MDLGSTADASAVYDVTILGCGPTGAALANLLGRRGLSVAVIDRQRGVLELPRAVHVDGETMRAFQAMQLHREMLAIFRPGRGMHWVDSQGDILLVRTGPEGLGPQGWHNDYYFHQPELEAVLRRGLARFANVQLHEGLEAIGHQEQSDGVRLDLRDTATGRTSSMRSRYLVGCDGARSIVRSWLGADHEDLGEHQAWLVVDAVLQHPLPLPEHTVQHCDPARPATSIYVHPLRRRWEIMLMPGDDPAAITAPESVWPLLRRWIQPGQGRLERASTYTFHALVARHWQRGRLLIAGDAAHQTPPFLGQGLCAGIRDAVNLAWKLPLALQAPEAAPYLLASYQSERTPHAREFVALAVEMGRIVQVTDAAAAAARNARLKAQGLQFAFPTPALGPGLHRADHAASGRVFMQPLLADGQWLDDAAAGRFAILLGKALAHLPAVKALAHDAVLLVHAPGAAARQWLDEHGAQALVLRPDGYVYAVCRDQATLALAWSALMKLVTTRKPR